MKLFREVQSCQDCLFSWEGYAHGFSRGHIVLEKNNRIAFVADDLGYFVPRGEPIQIENQLHNIGWHQLETCPKCGSRRLFPLMYNQDTVVEVPCIEIESNDLEKKQDGVWMLSANALTKFA